MSKKGNTLTKSLYIGCALTHAPETFRAEVGALKDSLRPYYDVFDFVGLEDGTDRDVYNWDIKRCTTEADLFVGIHGFPGDGLGYELGYRVEALRKPALSVAHRDAKVSRLVTGIEGPENPHFSFKRYNSLMGEVPLFIAEKLGQWSIPPEARL